MGLSHPGRILTEPLQDVHGVQGCSYRQVARWRANRMTASTWCDMMIASAHSAGLPWSETTPLSLRHGASGSFWSSQQAIHGPRAKQRAALGAGQRDVASFVRDVGFLHVAALGLIWDTSGSNSPLLSCGSARKSDVPPWPFRSDGRDRRESTQGCSQPFRQQMSDRRVVRLPCVEGRCLFPEGFCFTTGLTIRCK